MFFNKYVIVLVSMMEISISIEPYLGNSQDILSQYIVDIIKLKQKFALSGKKISLHFDYFKSNPEVFALVQGFSNEIDIDLHLMQEPAPSVEGFRSVSYDAYDVKNGLVNASLRQIDTGRAGLVLDLGCEINGIENLIREAAYIIVMTVKCGKSGQTFQSSALALVAQVRALNPHAVIIIDGGVNENSINLLKNAKINVAVVGSYAKKGYETGEFEFYVNRLLRV